MRVVVGWHYWGGDFILWESVLGVAGLGGRCRGETAVSNPQTVNTLLSKRPQISS